jgi:hypothetical protein
MIKGGGAGRRYRPNAKAAMAITAAIIIGLKAATVPNR